MWRFLGRERRSRADKKEKKMSAAAPGVIFHGESIKDFNHRDTNAVWRQPQYPDSRGIRRTLQRPTKWSPINFVWEDFSDKLLVVRKNLLGLRALAAF